MPPLTNNIFPDANASNVFGSSFATRLKLNRPTEFGNLNLTNRMPDDWVLENLLERKQVTLVQTGDENVDRCDVAAIIAAVTMGQHFRGHRATGSAKVICYGYDYHVLGRLLSLGCQGSETTPDVVAGNVACIGYDDFDKIPATGPDVLKNFDGLVDFALAENAEVIAFADSGEYERLIPPQWRGDIARLASCIAHRANVAVLATIKGYQGSFSSRYVYDGKRTILTSVH